MESTQSSKELNKEQLRERMAWDEITDTERIERLRYMIKQGQNQMSKLSQENSELRDQLRRHRHGDDHEVLVPASMANRGHLNAGCCEIAGSNHKPWF